MNVVRVPPCPVIARGAMTLSGMSGSGYPTGTSAVPGDKYPG
jgi:hypothetical protein